MSVGSEVPLNRPDAASLTEWQEPPLRTPAPSWAEYNKLKDGHGGQGVLEYMQPLGTVPAQRVKLRIKPFDNSRRPAHAKNSDRTAAGSEDIHTPDPAPPPPSRRSESRKTEDRASRLPASRVKDEDFEYTPNGLAILTPSKAVSSHSSQHGTPSSHIPTRNANLKEVVGNAVERAHGTGEHLLAHALNRLYEKSFQDPFLLDLIDAVLSERPTDQQKDHFQTYLKKAREQMSAETGIPLVKHSKHSKHSSRARGTSSDAKSTLPLKNGPSNISCAKATGMDLGLKNHDNSNPTSHPYSPSKSTQHNDKSNTSSMNPQVAPDRARRSNSTSSLSSVTSSLSSVDPNLALQGEEEFGRNSSPLPPPAAMAHGGKAKASAGPKMGTFTTSSSSKRPFAVTNPSKEDEEIAAKRRKLQKSFPDYQVQESDVRTHMQKLADKTSRRPSPPKLQYPAQQASRIRNGMDRAGVGEESDELDSPTTSMHSELLIPPPPFAGSSRRGATPTNLGRPPKTTKKSARVKMS
ncbi:MAG: hypothetical protein Q9166_003421 [cf. Caloplaca sp. 2 TL-2023]